MATRKKTAVKKSNAASENELERLKKDNAVLSDAAKSIEALKKENASLRNESQQLKRTIHNQMLLIGEQTMTIRQLAEQLNNSGRIQTVPNGPTKQ